MKKKRPQFTARPLHRRKEPHAMHYLSQRITFWIAVFSLFAFVTGNMMGQHGWRVFWKSVMGEQDDSLIVYTGTVPPVAFIPDFTKWSLYGEASRTFADVPSNLLVPLPLYESERQRRGEGVLVYSIGYMGSYATGAEGDGSHPGVDIRMPVGTPVSAVMNGIVTEAREEPGGFGKFIELRHPRVPDPEDPSKTVTLYSLYAHLSGYDVSVGQVVSKGQVIGQSGMTGFASGPHLHFQIERHKDAAGNAVSHPFWTFTGGEAREAGLTFTQATDRGLHQDRGFASTVNPLLYVQAQYAPVPVAQEKPAPARRTAEEIRRERIGQRIARRRLEDQLQLAQKSTLLAQSDEAASSSTAPFVPQALPVSREVAGIEIRGPRWFSGRAWETVTVVLKDASGDTAVFAEPQRDLYLRTAYGRAEFRPSVLNARDFQNGKAAVQMLPLGQTTVVIEINPGSVLSEPMRYRK